MTRSRANRNGISKESYIQEHESSAIISERYHVLQKIGAGAFGSVYLAQEKYSRKDCVCKIVSARTQQAYDLARREVELLRQMDHPCIVSLFEYSAEPSRGRVTMILEYIDGGSAYDHLARAARPLGEMFVGKLIYQLLLALNYCHSQQVIHRDVKPENLMLVQRLDACGGFDCKLIDFGYATTVQDEQGIRIGTPAYMAPEVVRKTTCPTQSDMWSLGVCAVQLLTRELLFGASGPENDKQNVFDAICHYTGMGELQNFLSVCEWWQGRSSNALEFLTSLLKVNSWQRPTAEQALGSTWMLHSAPTPKVSKELARSLEQYTATPQFVRCCLFAIAARRVRYSNEELSQLSDTFLAIDTDADGLVNGGNLEQALGGMFGHHLNSLLGLEPVVDVETVLAAADLDQSGSLSFTEFVAACLYSSYDSLDSLAIDAYRALDDDSDGRVCVKDIKHFFSEDDLTVLGQLPQNRSFCIDEWRSCMQRLERSGVLLSAKVPAESSKCEASFLLHLLGQEFLGCRGADGDGDGEYEIITVH